MIRLMQYDDYWTPLPDGQSISEYARLLHHWTHAILVTIEGHRSGYKFPLTPDDYERAAKLKSGLKGDSNVVLIDTFHDFIKLFLYPKKVGRPKSDYSKWDDPFECLYALSALREDGNFQPASTVTRTFAQMEYHFHGAILYEAFRVHCQTGLDLEE